MNLLYKLLLISVMAGIIGWVLPVTISNEFAFQIEVNNTNLAPDYSGGGGGVGGERIQGFTYYANNSPIQLFVFAHADSPGQTSEIHLYINGTLVADTSGKPLGTAEQNNQSIIAIIPRYASYKIEVNNFHHYEWREYRII